MKYSQEFKERMVKIRISAQQSFEINLFNIQIIEFGENTTIEVF